MKYTIPDPEPETRAFWSNPTRTRPEVLLVKAWSLKGAWGKNTAHFCLIVCLKRSKTYAFLTKQFVSELALTLQHSDWWKHLNSRQYLGENLIEKYFIGKVTQLYLSFFSLFKEALCMGHSGGNAHCKTQDGAEKRAIRLHIFLPSRLHEFCSWTCVKYVSFALYFRKYMFLAYLISDVPWQERRRPQANYWNWIERIHRVDWSKIDVQSVSVSQSVS